MFVYLYLRSVNFLVTQIPLWGSKIFLTSLEFQTRERWQNDEREMDCNNLIRILARLMRTRNGESSTTQIVSLFFSKILCKSESETQATTLKLIPD